MERPTLQAAVRDAKLSPDVIRAQGRVPAVIYGGDRKEAQSLSLNHSDLLRIVRTASESTIIDVTIDGVTVPVLLGEIQRDPLTEHMTHVDLRQIDLTKPVKASIELVFKGEPPAIKTLGGLLMINMDSIEVRALPTALVDHIDVDLSVLDSFDHSIHVGDITLPDSVELLDDPHSSVALVRAPKAEAFDEPVVATAPDAAAVPTVAEEEKKEKEAKEAEEAKADKT